MDYVIVLLESSVILGILENKSILFVRHVLYMRDIYVDINRVDRKILILTEKKVNFNCYNK